MRTFSFKLLLLLACFTPGPECFGSRTYTLPTHTDLLQTDSTAWIKLLHAGHDSIAVTVNGMLMSDGACSASLLLNIQKKENNEWKDCCGSHWSQMDCGLSFIFYRNERFTFNPGNILSSPGEYRFAVRTHDLGYLYSASFLHSRQ